MSRKKTLVSILLCLFVLIVANVGTFASEKESNNSKAGFMKTLMGKVIKDSQTSYTILENHACFDGRGYEENLSEYFAGSTENAYTYEISSGNPKNAEITLDSETGILTVIPHKKTIEKIVVSAYKGGEQPINIEFKLKYNDVVGYATGRLLLVSLIILVILVVVGWVLHNRLNLNAEVRVDFIPNECSETLSVKKGVAKIPEQFNFKGFVYMTDDKHIKFVSNKIFYYIEENEKKKAFSVISSVENKMFLYSDKNCTEGIEISFLSKKQEDE